MNNDFRHFLERKYLEWQQREGGRKTVFQFAVWLGVSQSAISNWWNEGRTPQGDSIRKLAEKLGLEVYDVLGLPRPDADLFYIQSIWGELTPEIRKAVRKEIEGLAQKSNEHRQTKPRKQTAT